MWSLITQQFVFAGTSEPNIYAGPVDGGEDDGRNVSPKFIRKSKSGKNFKKKAIKHVEKLKKSKGKDSVSDSAFLKLKQAGKVREGRVVQDSLNTSLFIVTVRLLTLIMTVMTFCKN